MNISLFLFNWRGFHWFYVFICFILYYISATISIDATSSTNFKPSYYDILEVLQTSTIEEIKKSYRRLSLIYHPDKIKVSVYNTQGNNSSTISAANNIVNGANISNDIKSHTRSVNNLADSINRFCCIDDFRIDNESYMQPQSSSLSVLSQNNQTDIPNSTDTHTIIDNHHHNHSTSNEHYCNDEDIEILKNYYLQMQLAYEVLSDSKKRIQYDLSLQGIDYQYIFGDDDDDSGSSSANHHGANGNNNNNKYKKSSTFTTFMKSSKFKLFLTIKFPKPILPDIILNLHIDVTKTLNDVSFENYVYYRRKICSVCQGKGGVECRVCSLCMGKGTSFHYYQHNSNSSNTSDDNSSDNSGSSSNSSSNINNSASQSSFQQVTETTCQNCGGKGCVIVHSPCTHCQSSGYTMIKEILPKFTIPKGLSITNNNINSNNGNNNHNQFILPHFGHQHRDGRMSNLVFNCIYELPIEFQQRKNEQNNGNNSSSYWHLDEKTGNLEYNIKIVLKDYVYGWIGDVTTPFQENIHVKTNGISDWTSLLDDTVTSFGTDNIGDNSATANSSSSSSSNISSSRIVFPYMGALLRKEEAEQCSDDNGEEDDDNSDEVGINDNSSDSDNNSKSENSDNGKDNGDENSKQSSQSLTPNKAKTKLNKKIKKNRNRRDIIVNIKPDWSAVTLDQLALMFKDWGYTSITEDPIFLELLYLVAPTLYQEIILINRSNNHTNINGDDNKDNDTTNSRIYDSKNYDISIDDFSFTK